MTLPLDEYAQRRRAREADVAARERVHIWLGNAKVAIFIAIAIYWALTLGGDSSAWVYGGAVAAFIALSIWHEVTLRAMSRANAAVAFYRDGAARIQDAWMRPEPSGERFKNANHPYADDLDIFGAGSMFQLLSLCRTPMGEERLAQWLLAPAADRRHHGTPGASGGAAIAPRSSRARRRGQRRTTAIHAARSADRLGRAATCAPAAPHPRCCSRAGIRWQCSSTS